MQMTQNRKAPKELSQNPYTVKTRNRRAQMSDVDVQIDKAKKADAGAVYYAITKLKKTEEYLALDEAAQALMRAACSEGVLHKRYVSNPYACRCSIV
jgi:hypothetical protein